MEQLTREDIQQKIDYCTKTIAEIELTNDKKRRLEWRNLKKVKEYWENQLVYSQLPIFYK